MDALTVGFRERASPSGRAHPPLGGDGPLWINAASSGCYVVSQSIGLATSIRLARPRISASTGCSSGTESTLLPGSHVDLQVQVDDAAASFKVNAEVVHRDNRGMGVKFKGLDREGRKQIKRFVVELTSVDATRQTATALVAVDDREAEPITSPESIRDLFSSALEAGGSFQLISADRQVRDSAWLREVAHDHLVLEAEQSVTLQAGEELFVLHTVDFVSYSFEASALDVTERWVEISLPKLVAYSERRSARRSDVSTDAWLELTRPWGQRPLRWSVMDVGAGGLSFRADPGDCQLLPGTPLSGATLVVRDEASSLDSAQVQHVTRQRDPGGEYLKVGVSFGGTERKEAYVHRGESRSEPPSGLMARLRGWMSEKATQVSYLWHRRPAKFGTETRRAPFEVVRYGRPGRDYVGLLNLTDSQEPRIRCPLVIVVPGFGGRKEQLGALALTLVENFRRNHQDLAVLRFDGSNNLGESWKDPGCEEDGKHNLHYTVSGVVEDIRAALDWARDNPRVDPTEVILVSISFASIAVRHFLAEGGSDSAGIRLWVSHNGAADARDAIHHVSGHLDLFENAARGLPNRTRDPDRLHGRRGQLLVRPARQRGRIDRSRA